MRWVVVTVRWQDGGMERRLDWNEPSTAMMGRGKKVEGQSASALADEPRRDRCKDGPSSCQSFACFRLGATMAPIRTRMPASRGPGPASCGVRPFHKPGAE